MVEETALGGAAREFPATRWTLIRSSAQSPEARRSAIEEILRATWKPLYHFARRKGLSIEDAKDMVQGFCTQLLERDFLDRLSPERGTLRSYLCRSLGNYLINRHESAAAAKRGGGAVAVDFESAEGALGAMPADPSAAFDREWATGIMERATERLRGEFSDGTRGGPFDLVLEFFRFGTAPSYAEAAAARGMTVSQLKAFLHRARSRFRELVREEVAHTVDGPEEVEAEMAELLRCLAS